MLLYLWGQSIYHPDTDDVMTELEKIPFHVPGKGVVGEYGGGVLFLLDTPV